MQYSKPKHLVEFIMQLSSGALQTAFGKSAVKGWIGDPDVKPTDGDVARRSGKPSQGTMIYRVVTGQTSGISLFMEYAGIIGQVQLRLAILIPLEAFVSLGSTLGSTIRRLGGYKGCSVTNWDAFGGMIRKDGLYVFGRWHVLREGLD